MKIFYPNHLIRVLGLSLCLLVLSLNSWGQDQNPPAPVQTQTQTQRNEQRIAQKGPETKFLLTGYGYTGFEKVGSENSTFGPAGFSPIFLWKKSDRLFFESEVEFEIEDGNLNIGLEYATLHYRLNKYLTLSGGKFLSPFGIFQERLHPAWINKFAEKPMGFSEEGAMIGPMTEFGASLRGGAQIGLSKVNYVLYVSNGPTLNTGSSNPMDAGRLDYNNLGDNNNNKAIGGRFGFLPFSSSWLEIGLSGQVAGVGNSGSAFQNVKTQMYAADLSIIKKVNFIKSNVDIKAQYNYVQTSKTNYLDTAGNSYTFNNTSTAWFSQIAIRPMFLEKSFLKNVEFTGRYSVLKTPQESYWAIDNSQVAMGINYWLKWNSVIKVNYQLTYSKGEQTEPGLFIQWGLGF
ncbi:MAG: hypothetical protein GC180_05305 [Bacteroidetes bacterium]|nr:hypothetical protein [Bacteroidota bacterium]